jgi:GNAT superfamily N-acetyltransferase
MKIDWEDVFFAAETGEGYPRPLLVPETGAVVYPGDDDRDEVDGLPIPSPETREEYRWMERFAASCGQPLRGELSRAIEGRGAFRRFKERLGDARDRWHAFRDARLREFVREWAEECELDLTDFPDPRPATAVGLRIVDDVEVDPEELAALFAAVGWKHRSADPDRLVTMLEGTRFAVVAWDGEQLVGFASAISDDAFNAYISTVLVLPSHLGRGIGSELVRRLLDGRDHLSWTLNAATEVAGFYARFGFVPNADSIRLDRAR